MEEFVEEKNQLSEETVADAAVAEEEVVEMTEEEAQQASENLE